MSWVSNRLKLWKQHRGEQRQKATERIAHTLYQRRVQLNRAGDQQSDWTTAEKIIKNPVRRTLFESKQPSAQAMKFIVWDTPRWFLFSLPHLEWVKLLAVPLVIAAAGSIITGQIQREANQNAVLKAYFDKLEELTFEQKLLAKKPNEGAIVLARGRTVAALRELDLPRREQLIAFLQASNLSRISEEGTEPIISFKGQNLSVLDLSGIALHGIDFQRANLERADLQGAYLQGANFSGADLSGAVLIGVDLSGADLIDADLIDADLSSTYLSGTNLSGAYLLGADLRRAVLLYTDLSNIENWTDRQLGEAILCNTTLPEGSKLDPNRDCPK